MMSSLIFLPSTGSALAPLVAGPLSALKESWTPSTGDFESPYASRSLAIMSIELSEADGDSRCDILAGMSSFN